jgi:hypothetical protein
MTQNLGDQRWIFSAGGNEGTVWPEAKKCPSEAVARAGNHSEVTATNRAGLDIDGEEPLEALCPSHRGGWVVGIDVPGAPRHDAVAVLEIRREYTRDGFDPLLLTLRVRRAVTLACAVKAGEVHPGAWHECGESRDEI